MIHYINQLPESIPENEIKDLMIMVLNDNNISIEEKFECIEELSDKQWHCYKLIDNELLCIIEKWIKENYRNDSIDIIRSIFNIIVRLGAQNTYDWLKKLNISNLQIRNIIIENSKELGENISNPYEK